MSTDNFLELLAQSIIEFLHLAMETVLGWMDAMPATWPVFAKALLILVVFVLALKVLVAIVAGAGVLPKLLIKRWRLHFWSAYGKSKWATRRALIKAGLTKTGGLFLGQWVKWVVFRQDLSHHGEGHFITIAAPGGGKSSAVIIPILLEAGPGNSFVVSDPSGEITAQTSEDQEKQREVVYLNPFYEDFKKDTGLDYKDTGFNPFDFIENTHDIRNQADILAQYLMVTDRRSMKEYFEDEGKELLSLFIAWMVRYEPKKNRTLSFLHVLLRGNSIPVLQEIIQKNDPLLLYDAKKFFEISQVKPHWMGVLAKAQLATKRYIPTTPLDIHTSKPNGFNPAILKEKDVTVYVLLPSKHLKSNSSWMNLVMGLIGESIGRAGKARPVTMLLDEAPALGFLPDLASQMMQHRKAGLRVWIFTQTVEAMSDEAMYGEKGFKNIFGLCETKQIFNIRQYDTAKTISEICGKTSKSRHSLDKQEDQSTSLAEVPLIRPEDILRLKKSEQILLYENTAPIKARLVPYFTRSRWKKRTNPNPYR